MNTWTDYEKDVPPQDAPAVLAEASPALLDWAGIAVQFDRDHPEKTIPLSWAADLLQDMHAANPASFGKKLAAVVQRWAGVQYRDGGQ